MWSLKCFKPYGTAWTVSAVREWEIEGTEKNVGSKANGFNQHIHLPASKPVRRHDVAILDDKDMLGPSLANVAEQLFAETRTWRGGGWQRRWRESEREAEAFLLY